MVHPEGVGEEDALSWMEEAEDFDFLETPSPPDTPVERQGSGSKGTASRQEQIKVLKAAQDILATHGFLNQPVLEAIEGCSSALSNQ